LAFETIDFLSKNLIIGQPIKKAYIATKAFINEKDSHLGAKVHTNFGFGVRI
jgi:hypothetical protein